MVPVPVDPPSGIQTVYNSLLWKMAQVIVDLPNLEVDRSGYSQ